MEDMDADDQSAGRHLSSEIVIPQFRALSLLDEKGRPPIERHRAEEDVVMGVEKDAVAAESTGSSAGSDWTMTDVGGGAVTAEPREYNAMGFWCSACAKWHATHRARPRDVNRRAAAAAGLGQARRAKPVKTYVCRKCSQEFLNVQVLGRHVKQQHGKPIVMKKRKSTHATARALNQESL